MAITIINSTNEKPLLFTFLFSIALNLIEALGELYPVILQRVLILELLPGATLMWSVDSWQIGKKIVLEAQIECLVRNLHIIPVLGRIKLLEVHLTQEFGLEQ